MLGSVLRLGSHRSNELHHQDRAKKKNCKFDLAKPNSFCE